MANRFPLIFNSGAGQIQELAASDNLDLTSSNLVNAGILFTSSGSVTAPSLQIGSGTTYNPGLYSPGTDQLAVATNGTSRLSIDASGNVAVDTNTLYVDAANNRVGVGTSAPVGPFHVKATTDRNLIVNTNIAGDLRFTALNDAANANVNLALQGDAIYFAAGGSERLRITSAGLVGIGTTSPEARLTTISTATFNGVTSCTFRSSDNINSSFYIGHGAGISNLVSDSALGFGYNNGSTYLERARIDTSGRLLVGTSSARSNVYLDTVNFTPTIQLESSGSNYNAGLSLTQYSANGYSPLLSFGQSASNTAGTNVASPNNYPMGYILFNGNDGTNFRNGSYIGAFADGAASAGSTPGRLVFATTPSGTTSPTERMRITSAGLVGIGTTSPGQLLQVGSSSGAIRVGTGTGLDITHDNSGFTVAEIKQLYATTSDAAQLKIISGFTSFHTGTINTERARIDSSGRLLVGTATQVGNVNGGILQLGSGITFPATAVAATDANTLDDYEEGTYSASVTCQGGTITLGTFTTVTYTKIGRMVSVNGYLYVSAVSSPSGFMRLNILPFAINGSNAATYIGGYIYTSNLNATAATAMQYAGANGDSFVTIEHVAAGVEGNAAADFKATSSMIISLSYFV